MISQYAEIKELISRSFKTICRLDGRSGVASCDGAL